MTNATVSRIGSNLTGGSDKKELFLKLFSGEVVTAFETNVIMKALHRERNITAGKSAQFPMTWKIGSSYHTPGAEIVGKQMNHSEKVITIDDLLISDAFLASIDEAMNHYEVRSVYTTEMGRELAKTYDKNVFRNVILAARATHEIDTDYNGGSVTSALNTGTLLADAIFAAAEVLDSKDVPDSDRAAVVGISEFYLLAQNTNIMNKDWGGAGNYSMAQLPPVAGIQVYKSNNIANADDTSNTNIPTAYRANFSTTKGAVFHKDAAGTVKLMDMALESEYDIRRQGTLFVAKYAVGHGKLRSECAVELKTA